MSRSNTVYACHARASRLRDWAHGLELLRELEPPEIRSLMLDCANRLNGAAKAHEDLAAALERPITQEDLP